MKLCSFIIRKGFALCEFISYSLCRVEEAEGLKGHEMERYRVPHGHL